MDPVSQAYDALVEREWNRLVSDPYHSLEFLVTQHFLRKYLPRKGVVLDAGGGPGRYALELCRAGYQVVLLDISPGNIAMARDNFRSEPASIQNRLLEYVLGDIRDLSCFEDARFDAVLCLGGPLTHLSHAEDRYAAMRELVRIAKPGATVFVSVVGYLAVLRTILAEFSHEITDPSFETLVDLGDTMGPTRTLWHFFRADELRELAESCRLTTVEMAGCEGLSTGLAEATNDLAQDEARWQRWVELVLATCIEPATVDLAEHILYVGQKADGRNPMRE